ncbi:MAG TPA: hypothetical protein VEU96_16265 [Bryobacteraceae bacterium]|nr:hypothetical protein [Bryobacteraceae bacterium]
MAVRINERLSSMAAAAEGRATTACGTALVVVKNAIVEDAFGKLGMHLRIHQGPPITDPTAYRAGRSAGDDVNLNRPLPQPDTGVAALD